MCGQSRDGTTGETNGILGCTPGDALRTLDSIQLPEDYIDRETDDESQGAETGPLAYRCNPDDSLAGVVYQGYMRVNLVLSSAKIILTKALKRAQVMITIQNTQTGKDQPW